MEFEDIKNAIANDENVRAQLAEYVTEDENIRTAITEGFAKKGFEVLNEESKNTLLANHKKSVIEEAIPSEIKKVHDQYDNDLKSLGFERNQNEKTYEAVKRIIGTLKSDVDKAKAGSGTDEQIQKRIQAIEDDARQKIEAANNQLNDFKSKYELKEKESSVQGVYGKIKPKIKSDLPSYFASHEEKVLQHAIKNSKLEDGVLVMLNDDGSVMKENFAPITVEKYLSEQFKDVFKEDKPAGGTGSGKSASNAGADPDAITAESYVIDISVINTPEKLTKQMIEDGLVRGTAKFTEIFHKWNQKILKK